MKRASHGIGALAMILLLGVAALAQSPAGGGQLARRP